MDYRSKILLPANIGPCLVQIREFDLRSIEIVAQAVGKEGLPGPTPGPRPVHGVRKAGAPVFRIACVYMRCLQRFLSSSMPAKC